MITPARRQQSASVQPLSLRPAGGKRFSGPGPFQSSHPRQPGKGQWLRRVGESAPFQTKALQAGKPEEALRQLESGANQSAASVIHVSLRQSWIFPAFAKEALPFRRRLPRPGKIHRPEPKRFLGEQFLEGSAWLFLGGKRFIPEKRPPTRCLRRLSGRSASVLGQRAGD